MIRSFADKDSRLLFEGRRVKRFRTIERQAQKRLRYLHNASSIQDLAALRSNRFEILKGDRKACAAYGSTTNGVFVFDGRNKVRKT